MTSYKFGRPLAHRKRRVFQEPAEPYLFDADPRFIEEVSAGCRLHGLVDSLKGKTEAQARDILAAFGRQLMKLTIELADGKYLDRTGQMVEEIAQELGILFPHRLERYVELSILGLRPLDRWDIPIATPRQLNLQVQRCSVYDALHAAGLGYQGMPCQRLCLASFEAAAARTGDQVEVKAVKEMLADGVCEFCLTPLKPLQKQGSQQP